MIVNELETPSVLIDLDVLEQNIQRMQAHCNSQGVKLRPHIKSHKAPEIAALQMEAGAIGIACQKTTEAAVFAEAGFNDIQIPYNIVGPQKTKRLADLALYNHITVVADHPSVVRGVGEAAAENEVTIRILVELATEVQRNGTTPYEAVNLAKRIDEHENLHFAGLMGYQFTTATRPVLQEALNLLHQAGIGVDKVVNGGTGSALHTADLPEVTEVCAGTYAFNDLNCVTYGWATLDDCAMHVAATVVSRPTRERAILDSGSKTLSSDVVDDRYGYILEYPAAVIYKLNEEHAHVDLSQCEDVPVIGERVHVLPVHGCVVANLHNQLYGIRGDTIETTWSVAARGKVW
jgi:D-serine deaminase-like pyridoxal phosphate-dependent protein